ncbi:integrase core domain-containing protein [Magnetovibrio blakemorei]|uniref:integrase core domain-containing protein n=1 Tax=Magnetovibrio blakemorei TaxID=28181 RepID=UPI001B8D65B1|nr:integrase core domain-containing protein [Magnetovibrio blakemorei]
MIIINYTTGAIRAHIYQGEEVQDAATKWLWTYNNERPNMAIGGLTPIQKLTMEKPMAA